MNAEDELSVYVRLPEARQKSKSLVLQVLLALFRHRLGLIGMVFLAIITLVSAFAPLLTPFSPTLIDYDAILMAPSLTHWFGTDEIGRDIFSRVIYGGRTAVQVIVLSVAIALVIGSAIGLMSGFYGGWIDDVIMRVMDGLLSFPMLILALTVITVLGPNLMNAILAIAIVNIPGFARLVRGEVLSVRQMDYVQAAVAVGASDVRIMALHIWRNISGTVIVFASLRGSQALITESALSFLGLGVQPPLPAWGQMIAVGMEYSANWWLSFFPGLLIFATVIGLNFLGDALRDVLDSRTAKR